jgi:N-acetylglucosaminyldiphosphoundecaprenol N-acetyl-beta-D-mannosaminyltransferase
MRYFFLNNIKIDNFSKQEVIQKIEELLKEDEKGYVVTPNAAHFVDLEKDAEFRIAYTNAKLILPDGMSIVWASKILKCPIKERCTGSDLFYEVCAIAEKLHQGVFLLGGTDGSEVLAADKLKIMLPMLNVNHYSPMLGFEKDEEESNRIINCINRSKSKVLFVCVGTPKSEKWIYRNISKLNITLALSFGKSIDYFSGKTRRAPVWVQKGGMEWAFRLIQEPKRLWKRYLIGNILFLWFFLKKLIRREAKQE